MWSVASATAGSVTDSAGNTYTELTHFTASDGTELSVWTAQVTSGGGTIPTLTAKPTGSADVGVAVLEYSGVSSVGGASVVDVQGHASGKTSAAATIAAGATAPTTAAGELALGFYADSGFGNTLTAGSGFTSRVNVSKVSDMELLAEEQITGAAGATPNATFGTGASTIWLAATVVLKPEGSGAATTPSAPTNVAATAGNGSAVLTWTAPADGGSPVTSYTVTPYADGVAGTPTVVTGAPPAATATLSGLSNAVPYTFTVSAANAVGAGAVSQPSNTVVPGPVPNGQFGALQTWPIVAVHSAVLDRRQGAGLGRLAEPAAHPRLRPGDRDVHHRHARPTACSAAAWPSSRTAGCWWPAATARPRTACSASPTPTSSTRRPTPGPAPPTCI